MRVRTPWIQALRESLDGKKESHPPRAGDPDTSPKKMSDSFVRVILPLAQDPWMLDNYANATGQIRLGTLLMDLDALSGVIAYKHTGEGVTTVTAAVDRIFIKHPLKEICDLELSGQVTFATGRSSMEVSLQVAKTPAPGQKVQDKDVLITCAFTMVSLNPITKKPVKIAPIKVESESERKLFDRGQENYNKKKALRQETILEKAPDENESGMIHEMWTESLAYRDHRNPLHKPHNVSYMSSTTIHSAQIMQPQYRNRHNFMIFGGYLLKQTFELAFTCAAAFSHTRPSFISLDPSTFEEPVPVGSVLYVSASIVYTEPSTAGGTRISVAVTTQVRDVDHADRKSTGSFFYTFLVDKDVRVMPQSYSEFMRWVDGRRRAKHMAASLEVSGDALDRLTMGDAVE
ncbi:putative acylthioester [Phaeomoniella chlamydospora]|uniref:Putative acylthioester n=1 Tax=Phaeomoniella chlamydospora TaxID=158046 RepID=A0A0G2H581_PHACM|nr:putative acylthioester [Phaeomoniella chlamydospora]